MNRWAELWEDWRYLYRQKGHHAWPEIVRDLRHLPGRHLQFYVLERPLQEPLPDLPPKVALELRPFRAEDVPLVRQIDRPSEARMCGRRLRAGHIGMAAWHAGRLVGYAWALDETAQSLERVTIPLMPGEVLFTDAYTAPSFRGRGVQTALAMARLSYFQQRGYRRAWMYIEIHNAPSLAVWERKFGSYRSAMLDFYRVGPWRWQTYRPLEA